MYPFGPLQRLCGKGRLYKIVAAYTTILACASIAQARWLQVPGTEDLSLRHVVAAEAGTFKGMEGWTRSLLAAAPSVSPSTQRHEATVLPLSARDAVLFTSCFTVLALAAGAGVGGGVLLVPLLSLVGGFSFIETVALSNTAILAGAVTNLIFNLPRRHPFQEGPVIDYHLLLLFGAPIVMGSVAGSKMNYYIPSWITKTLVLVVLAPMAWRMVQKARFLWTAENAIKRQAHDAIQTAAAASSAPLDSHDVLCSLPNDHTLDSFCLDPASKLSPSSSPKPVPANSKTTADRCSSLPVPATPTSPQQADPFVGRSISESQPKVLSRSHLPGNALCLYPLKEFNPIHSSDADLVRLLGPELMLLTSTSAAKATIEVQHSSRLLQKQMSTRLSRGSSLGLNKLPSLRLSSRGDMTTPVLRRKSSSTKKHSTAGVLSRAATPDAPKVRSVNRVFSIEEDESESIQVPLDATAASKALDCSQAATGLDPSGATALPHVYQVPVISPFQLHQEELQRKHSHTGLHSTAAQQNTLQRRQSGTAQRSGSMKLAETGACPDLQAQDKVDRITAKKHCLRFNHQDCHHSPELEDKMLDHIERHATAQYPRMHILCVIAILAVVVIATMCASYLTACNTWQYWVVILLPLPAMMVPWAMTRWHVLWRVGWQEYLDIGGPASIAWTPRSTLVYPACCIIIGLMAGLLGMGGGTFMTPMFLELGVNPATAAASSQSAMLVSTCASCLVYLTVGAASQDFVVSMAILGLVGTFFGQTAINYIVRRTGRPSLLVFALTVMFILALGAVTAVVILAVLDIVHDPSLLGANRADLVCPY